MQATKRSDRPWSKAALAATGGVLVPLVFPGAAGAVDSGELFRFSMTANNGSQLNACGRTTSGLNAGGRADSWGYAYSRSLDTTNNDCEGGVTLPAGYIGAVTWLYKDGSVCSSNDGFNGGNAVSLGLNTTCSNPSGDQNWQGLSQAWFYKGQYCQPNECYVGYKIAQAIWSPISQF